MTVIAFKDGVLAADTLATTDGGMRGGYCQKIGLGKDGSLWGFCGEAWKAEKFAEWAQAQEADPPEHDHKESCGILILADGRVRSWYGTGWSEVEASFYAWGCGDEVAMGAMAHGASAETAVGIAIMLKVDCGGQIDVIRLGEHRPAAEDGDGAIDASVGFPDADDEDDDPVRQAFDHLNL